MQTRARSKLHFVEKKHYKCTRCERVFAFEEALKIHTKHKHPDRSIVKKYKCDLCLYSSDLLDNFKCHMRSHTKEKPFECYICCKTFSQSHHLKRHIRSHTKETEYKCTLCGKNFTRSSSLKMHKLTVHDKLKPHVCEVCGLRFGLVCHYKRHLFTHSRMSNYECRFCNKMFSSPYILQEHVNSHLGIKPHKCKECFVAFSNSSSLYQHFITQHSKNFPHRCPVCNKGFMALMKLNRHSNRCKKSKV